MLRIVIPEPIPSMNKGEEAILGGIRQALEVLGDYDLAVYSPLAWYEEDTKNAKKNYRIISGIDLYDLSNWFSDKPIPRGRTHIIRTWGLLIVFSMLYRISKKLALSFQDKGIFHELALADVILAGHDGMLGYMQFWIVLSARIMKKPIILYGGGNDGIGRKKYRIRKCIEYMVHKANLCTVRDSGTFDFLIANGVNKNMVHLFPDPAVLLKPSDAKIVKVILSKENIPANVPYYGVIPARGGIVFEKSFSDETNKENKHKKRVELWTEIIIHILNTTDAHIIFIPHCIGPTFKNDDRRMMNDVYNNINERKDRLTVINNEYSAEELKGLIRECDYILGERTHGLIGAVSVATPCMALSVKEDLRMHNIIGKMFHRITYNLNEPNIDELKMIVKNEWDERNNTRIRMKEIADKVHNEACKAALMMRDAIDKAI